MTNDPIQGFERAIIRKWPKDRWQDRRLVLAVSGGADSMALLNAFRRIAADNQLLAVAHFNHRWRGTDSDHDEGFVAETAKNAGLAFHVGRASEDVAKDSSTKSEQSARQMRYRFLTELAYQIGASYVVTAHTASDQVETSLHNLFRGSGVAGLRGMQFCRPLDAELVLARPMIDISRDQVEAYLGAIGAEHREDASNNDEAYQRNFIRHQLLPLLRERFNEKVDARILETAKRFEAIEGLLQRLANEYFIKTEELWCQQPQMKFGICLESDHIAFPVEKKLNTDWVVLQLGLSKKWLEFGWPLSEMNQQKWKVIEACWKGKYEESDKKWRTIENLPGDLLLRVNYPWVAVYPAKS